MVLMSELAASPLISRCGMGTAGLQMVFDQLSLLHLLTPDHAYVLLLKSFEKYKHHLMLNIALLPCL